MIPAIKKDEAFIDEVKHFENDAADFNSLTAGAKPGISLHGREKKY